MSTSLTMPNDWNDSIARCSYPVQLSPLISMSSFVNEGSYYYPSADYPHTYASSSSAPVPSSQLMNSLSYQAYHHPQINSSASVDTEAIHPVNQPQQDVHAPNYSYLDALAYSTRSIKVEAINPSSSEVTSTSTSECNVDNSHSVNQVAKNTRKGGKKSINHKSLNGCLKRVTHGRRKNKPEISYATMIWMAIDQSPDKKLTLCEIYNFFQEKWPEFFIGSYIGWKNSVRHNLSLNECFVRVSKSESDYSGASSKSSNKGSYWTVLDSYKPLFESEKGYQKRRPRNFRKLVESTTVTQVALAIADHSQHAGNSGHYKPLQDDEVVVDFYRKTTEVRGTCLWNSSEQHGQPPDLQSMSNVIVDNLYDDLPYSIVN